MFPARAPLFVVDDDPTGPQDQADVPLLLSWRSGLLEAALREEPPAVHLLTNSRALGEDEAYAAVRDATEAAAEVSSHPRLVLRGDSTLRAHLLPEYMAVRDAFAPDQTPPLLLVPALPKAGRVTCDGRHWLVRSGSRIPLDQTEFASDGAFAYGTARLRDWAEERSDGFFVAEYATEIPLASVRSSGGADRVAEALLEACGSSHPSVVVPDAETEADLQAIAQGLRQAWAREPAIVVRCAPALASVLSGATATGQVTLPVVERGLLVVVGSHVPMSSAQLAAVNTAHPRAGIEVDAAILADDRANGRADATIATAVEQAGTALERDRLAIVSTSRALAAEARGPEAGMRVARALASVVDRLRDQSDVLISKGGITSAVNVREGLHARRAQIVGPVSPGVSLWSVYEDGGRRPVIVFPGNVGNALALARLTDRLLREDHS